MNNEILCLLPETEVDIYLMHVNDGWTTEGLSVYFCVDVQYIDEAIRNCDSFNLTNAA